MANNFYVYHHPSVTGKTFDQAVEEKILIGTRFCGPHRTISFRWEISPFEFMHKYYGDSYWIIDDNGHAMHCYGFALKMAEECKVVKYESSSEPAQEG